jgi:hypothetical protein
MKRSLLVAALALVGFLMTSTPSHADGKSVFLTNKCTHCHTVNSMHIARSGDEEKPVDLSKVGAQKNADWIKKYLLKETDLKGKKHKKAWKGSDADLNALAGWLAGLK